MNVLLWIASILIGVGVIFGLSHLRHTNRPTLASWDPAEAVLYIGFHKVGWSLALAWVVFACVNGYGGIINKFLSWGFFLPLARMQYVVYLIHFDFTLAFFSSLTYSIELTDVIAVRSKFNQAKNLTDEALFCSHTTLLG